MALEVKVHGEVKGFEAKVIGPLSWRQFACVALGIPTIALVTWLMWDHQKYLSAADMLVFLPFAVWGWWRPKGLKPEAYIKSTAPEFFGPKEFRRESVNRQPKEGKQSRSAVRRGEHHRKVRALEGFPQEREGTHAS